MKSGFICIAGLANAGKSTLINALVGEKVAIVSWRPQTTRDRILGIVNDENYQIVLIDTPGILQVHNQLGEYMMQNVQNSLNGVDGMIYVIDVARGMQKEDYEMLQTYATKMPIIVAVNKQDTVVKDTLFQVLDKLNGIENLKAIVPISAKKEDNLEPLLDEIINILPEGPKLYPDDIFTDSSMRFMTQEIIREKALYLLDKEIPYGIAVSVNQFEYKEEKNVYVIDADIICERQSHKAIVIGKNGEMIKQISTKARKDIEKLVGCKVFLNLYVRVKSEWRDNDYLMKELGYDLKSVKKDK